MRGEGAAHSTRERVRLRPRGLELRRDWLRSSNELRLEAVAPPARNATHRRCRRGTPLPEVLLVEGRALSRPEPQMAMTTRGPPEGLYEFFCSPPSLRAAVLPRSPTRGYRRDKLRLMASDRARAEGGDGEEGPACDEAEAAEWGERAEPTPRFDAEQCAAGE